MSPVIMLDGNNLNSEGRISAEGRVRLGVDLRLSGQLITTNSSTDVHLAGGGRSFFENSASASGSGQLTIDNGSTLSLENGASVGIDVENDGRLEIGFMANEVSVDIVEPGAALIRGNFSQTSDGEFAVDLAGLSQAAEYDWLDVVGPARLNGTVVVQLIDSFVPTPGDTFQILTATAVINTFDDILTVDESDMLDFELTAIYSASDVVLRIDDVFLSADFDRDGDVDGADFLILQSGLGLTMQSDNTNGDADGDGIVNGTDLLVWESQHGLNFEGLAAVTASVPEAECCDVIANRRADATFLKRFLGPIDPCA